MKKITLRIILILIISQGLSEKVFPQVSPSDSLFNPQADSITIQTNNDSTLTIRSSVNPYRVNAWVSIGISVVGSVGDYFAIPRFKDKKTITDAELAALNPSILTGLDRWALKQDPTKRGYYDKLSDNVITGIFLLPVTLAFDKNIRHDGLKLLLMYYESQVITFSIFNYSFLGPTFQNKYRPMTYYTDIPVWDRNIGNNRNSFFAGHVSSATAASFFMVKVYCDYHPNIGAKKYLLYTAATIPALTMGYLRVLALKHFPSDVLVGMMVGAVSGVAIPSLHALKYKKNVKLGLFVSPEGASGLSMNWNFSR